MKLPIFHLMIFIAGLLWFIGSGLLLAGTSNTMNTVERYSLSLCQITSVILNTIGSHRELNRSWALIEVKYQIGKVVLNSSFDVIYDPRYEINGSVPCYVDSTVINIPTTHDEITGSGVRVGDSGVNYTTPRPENSTFTGHLYLTLPSNQAYVIGSLIFFIGAFLLSALYSSIHFFKWWKHRKYRQLSNSNTITSGSGFNEPADMILVDNLSKPNLLERAKGSFSVAQSVLWERRDLFTEEEFGELRDFQIKAIVAGGSEQSSFQYQIYRILKSKSL